MPIAPEKMKLYPGGSIYSAAWQDIRNRILQRAGNCCEGTPQFPYCRAMNGCPHPETDAHVVLTIAHLNQDVSDSSDENLAALCQRCHNSWDAKHRQAHARQTRALKVGQMDLL